MQTPSPTTHEFLPQSVQPHSLALTHIYIIIIIILQNTRIQTLAQSMQEHTRTHSDHPQTDTDALLFKIKTRRTTATTATGNCTTIQHFYTLCCSLISEVHRKKTHIAGNVLHSTRKRASHSGGRRYARIGDHTKCTQLIRIVCPRSRSFHSSTPLIHCRVWAFESILRSYSAQRPGMCM